MWTLPVISFAVYAVLYAIAEKVSKRTRGIVSSLLFLSIAYLIGFLTGIFPKDAISATGIPVILSAFGTVAIVTNLGTLLSLKQFAAEWKTVAVCLGGIAALAAFGVLLDGVVFDEFFGLCTIPAISGGVVAMMIMKDALVSCAPKLIAFTMLLFALHSFVGIPMAGLMLRKYCMTSPRLDTAPVNAAKKELLPSVLRVKESEAGVVLFARLAMVMALAAILAHLTQDVVPASILGLLLGVIMAELGFLPENPLQKCGYYDMLIFFILSTVVDPFALIDLPSLLDCLVPLLFFMVGGCGVVMLGGMLVGKLLHMDARLACALSCACMIGFPGTLIVAQDVVDGIGYEDEALHRVMRESLGIKMVIAGFATVSTSSIVIASLLVPLLQS